MIGLLRAEITKVFKRRTFWVLLIVLALLTGLLAAVFFILPRFTDESGLPEITKPGAYLLGVQQVLGQTWFPLILATMALAGDLATSSWATTLTRNSRRWQHLAARVITTTGASWLAMLAAIGGFSLVTFFLAEGSGSLLQSEWVSIGWKSLLVQFTWVTLGLAFSAWLRSVGPAIGAALAFSFAEGILSLWQAWRNISLSMHTSALLGSLELGGPFGNLLGELASFTKGLIVVLAWAMVSLVVAWAGLQYRDA